MRKKKEKKWAKKLKKHCHRTPCSECALYSDRCRISNYPTPAYWNIKKQSKGSIHESVSWLYQEGRNIDEIALTLRVSTNKVKRCLMDINKARMAAGIRMIEEEK